VPVEVYGRAPAQQNMVVHFSTGVSTRTFDGHNEWMAGPDTPVPLVTLNEGNLDRARLETMIDFRPASPGRIPNDPSCSSRRRSTSPITARSPE
jgi:hypothetical protein